MDIEGAGLVLLAFLGFYIVITIINAYLWRIHHPFQEGINRGKNTNN